MVLCWYSSSIFAHTNDYPDIPTGWYIFYGAKIILLLSALIMIGCEFREMVYV